MNQAQQIEIEAKRRRGPNKQTKKNIQGSGAAIYPFSAEVALTRLVPRDIILGNRKRGEDTFKDAGDFGNGLDGIVFPCLQSTLGTLTVT